MIQLCEDIFAVGVPMDADFEDYSIENGKIYFDVFDSSYWQGSRELPPGNWQFLGCATQDGADFDVEPYVKKEFDTYWDYEMEGYFGNAVFNTPSESLLSLLRYKGVDMEGKKYAIIKKQ